MILAISMVVYRLDQMDNEPHSGTPTRQASRDADAVMPEQHHDARALRYYAAVSQSLTRRLTYARFNTDCCTTGATAF